MTIAFLWVYIPNSQLVKFVNKLVSWHGKQGVSVLLIKASFAHVKTLYNASGIKPSASNQKWKFAATKYVINCLISVGLKLR